METDIAFTSADNWVRVSTKLIAARRVVLVLGELLVLVIVVALFLIPAVPNIFGTAVAILGLVALIWLWWLIGRRVRSYAYCNGNQTCW